MTISSTLPNYSPGNFDFQANDLSTDPNSFAGQHSDLFKLKTDSKGNVTFLWNLGQSTSPVVKNYKQAFDSAIDPDVSSVEFANEIFKIDCQVLGEQISQVDAASKGPAVFYAEADKISNDLKQGSASGDASGLNVLMQEKDAVFTMNCFVSWLQAVDSNPELLKTVFKDGSTYDKTMEYAQKLLDGGTLNQDEMTALKPVFLKFMDSFVPPELRPDVLPSTVQQLHQKNDELSQNGGAARLAGF